MTSRSYNNWLLVAGAFGVFVSLFSPTAEGQSQSGITAFVERDGRTIFTNFSISARPTVTVRPAGPTIGPAPATPTAGPFDDLIQTISGVHGLDPALTRAVIEVESNFDSRAISHAGAQGLMQLIPDTASRFGVRDVFDPAQNIEGGVRYLTFLLEMFDGDFDLSLAAYNSGENRVKRIGRIPDIAETQDYVRKVRASYTRMGGTPDRAIRVANSQNVAAAAPGVGAATGVEAATVVAADAGVDRNAERTPSDSLRVETASAQPAPIAQGISRSTNRRGVVSYTNFGANQ